jgi:hypothetical protein
LAGLWNRHREHLRIEADKAAVAPQLPAELLLGFEGGARQDDSPDMLEELARVEGHHGISGA